MDQSPIGRKMLGMVSGARAVNDCSGGTRRTVASPTGVVDASRLDERWNKFCVTFNPFKCELTFRSHPCDQAV